MTQAPKPNTPAPETEASPQAWVTVARVVRPQGRKGELLADLLTDFPERFAERRRLFLRPSATSAPREVLLEQHWLHKGRLVLKFQGIDSIEAAELLRDHDVVIPRAERAPLDEDAVYIGDLAGCDLYDRATAAMVGEIVGVDRESSSMPLIVVRSGTRSGTAGELLIPFAKAYLPHIDLEARRMEMTLPEGILALNDPITPEERQELAAEQREGNGGTPSSQNSRPAHRPKRR